MFDNFNLPQDFAGVNVGMPEERQWAYPTIGYHITSGDLFVDKEAVRQIKFTPFAIRESKSITTPEPESAFYRYPLMTKKQDMVQGEFGLHLQVVGLLNGQLHIFGANKETARRFWNNPDGGNYCNPIYPTGAWPRLLAYIAEHRKRGNITSPLCWELTIEPENEKTTFVAAANKKMSSSGHRLAVTGIEFVGAERAAENAALFESEKIAAWVKEWQRRSVETSDTPTDDEQPDQFIPAVKEDEIPW